MSVPALTNAIIQPQNIILNQVPLTTVITNVNATAGVPITAVLTPAPVIDQVSEIKTVQPTQNTNTIKSAITSQMSTTDHPEILPKSRLLDLVREVDPNLVLEDEVEDLLLNFVDEFIDRVLNGACTFAKHRQENTIDIKDVQQFLIRNYNIWTPGSGTDELKPYKRSMTMESHKQRMALIRRALKKY